MKKLFQPTAMMALVLLAAFCVIGLRLVQNSPEIIALDTITILPSDEDIILGSTELFQHSGFRSAEKEHLLVRHRNDRWQIANSAWRKKVDIRTTRQNTRYLKRWQLKTGDRLRIDGTLLTVTDLGDNYIIIEAPASGRQLRWVNV